MCRGAIRQGSQSLQAGLHQELSQGKCIYPHLQTEEDFHNMGAPENMLRWEAQEE